MKDFATKLRPSRLFARTTLKDEGTGAFVAVVYDLVKVSSGMLTASD